MATDAEWQAWAQTCPWVDAVRLWAEYVEGQDG